ncbi:MAG: hypothetical protein KTR25_13225 [Myxococcales bacterium]|nr:hypothetical protein [Myxococcales bacterium]
MGNQSRGQRTIGDGFVFQRRNRWTIRLYLEPAHVREHRNAHLGSQGRIYRLSNPNVQLPSGSGTSTPQGEENVTDVRLNNIGDKPNPKI